VAQFSGGTSTRVKAFTWFGAHSDYKWSTNNSEEVAKGWILSSPDLAGLATKIQVNPDVLAKTVATYNDFCMNKRDAEFQRPADTLLPLERGPFYAMKTYSAMYNTQGGPRRNGKYEVLDVFGKPIPRLYSGGEMGSFFGWMYNGGGNNAEAMVTGQIAARNVLSPKPLK